METEVHVYAFSIAANVLLSLFPFLLVMQSILDTVAWTGAEQAVRLALRDTFGPTVGDFLIRNALDTSRPRIEFVSIFLLLFTANGIFEPLEVALNRAWGVTRNRSFLRNQLVSMGLIFICGALALASISLSALNREIIPGDFALAETANNVVALLFYKTAAVPLSILSLFIVYWLLPNRQIPPKQVVAPAILVGLALEVLKYIHLLLTPWLQVKLRREYGPFINSVTILLWSFFASMVVLAGAEWTARVQAARQQPGISVR